MCLSPPASRWSLALVCFSLLAATEALAAGGIVVTFPQPGAKIKSGLVMTLDMRGVDANGYRPVKVDFRTLTGAPLTADRQVRIVITPRTYSSSLSCEVTQIVDLAEGTTGTSATIAVPQSSQWFACAVEVYEDGDQLKDLSSPGLGLGGVNFWDWSEARPTMLVIDADAPDRTTRDALVSNYKSRGQDPNPTYNLPEVRMLANLFPDPNRNATYFAGQTAASDVTLLANLADQYPRLEILPPSELPQRWIDLSQFDVTFIPLPELKQLAAQEPKRFQALSDWVAGGPLLVVTGVGNDFAGLAEIDKLLSLPKLPIDPRDPAEFRGWRPADNNDHRSTLRAELEDLDATMQPVNAPMQAVNTPNWNGAYRGYTPRVSVSGDDQPLKAPAQTPFASRPCGLGMIVGIASDKPFPGDENDWRWVFNSVPRNHWMWYQRNGFSLHRTNGDYWKFLIPGVGEAPVVSFLLLVSLFAVLIGPVNYMLLGRARRLYLLLITVPVGAALVTGSLFTYALMTDGLGVRLRVRSYTDLDQRTGRAAAWSRQTYYASIAPSRGLEFPEDATIFPIRHQPGVFRGNNGEPSQFLTWDEGQNLTRGYLSSRTATQYMVLRATESTAKLAVREGQAAGQPPEITNQLETDIRALVLRDSRGALWLAENIDADAAVTLTETTDQAASKLLDKLYDADPPKEPRGYDPNLHHNNALSIFMPNFGGWYGNVDSGSSMPLMASSLLEKNLVLSTDTAKGLLPGRYLAITDASPVVPYGVPRVREESSLHMIRGRY